MTGHNNNVTPGAGNKTGTSVWDDLPVLIKECIEGNPAAEKALYEKYSPMVFGVIKRYLKQTEPAEEVLNDAFYSIFRYLHQYTFKGAFEGWIYRITVNAVAYYFKRNSKHKDVVYKEQIDEQVAMDSNAIQQMSYKELLELVYSIPDTQRIVFNLYVFEQYSHKEISKVLKISDGASRWYLNDARKRLKEKINHVKK